jgi:hypothetical protein
MLERRLHQRLRELLSKCTASPLRMATARGPCSAAAILILLALSSLRLT